MTKVTKIAPASAYYSAVEPMRVVKMGFAEFAAIETNPGQRDHEIRDVSHLKNFELPHLAVSIVALPDGRVYKVDGHTRVEAVRRGVAPHLMNMEFQVTVYSVDDPKKILRLYEITDNTKSTKNGQDRIQSAYRLNGMTLSTPWLRKGAISAGLQLAYVPWARENGLAVGAMQKQKIDTFQRPIELLDSISPKKDNFVIGVLAGILLALKRYDTKVLPFVTSFNDSMGLAHKGKRDPVRMLHDFLESERDGSKMAGNRNNDEHMDMTMALIKRHMDHPNKLYDRMPKPITPREFLA